VNKLNKVNVIRFIHFHARFSSREGRRGTSPRRTQNTSRSTAIPDSSVGSTPRRDQARSEVQTLHLVFGRPLGCFPVDLASRTCLTSLSWAFWIHGRTNVVVISEFGEVVRHSGLCEFHSCALGAPKSPNNVAGFFFNTVHLLPKDLRFEHGCAQIVTCPGRNLTSVRPCHTVDSSQKSHLWRLHLG